jgi:hypothetical protein
LEELIDSPARVESTTLAPATPEIAPGWGRFSSILLRFFFAYWLAYSLSVILMFPIQFINLELSQIGGQSLIPDNWLAEVMKFLSYPGTYFQQGMNWFTPWVNAKILGVEVEPPTGFTGSGDRLFNYCTSFAYLALAVGVTVIWTILSELWRLFRTQRAPNYDRLYAVMRLIVRFHLMYQMVVYGTMKVWCAQFPPINDFQLETKYGDSSPMGLLWRFMQFSQPYTSATGIIEFVCGLLLISRRTTLLGAFCTLGATLQVFLLNMCYDVPVKLMSGQLVLMSLTLIVPEWKRLLSMFVLGKPVSAAPLTPIFGRRKWLEWTAIGLRTCVFLSFAALMLLQAYRSAKTRGVLVPQNPSYGRWATLEFLRNGEKVAFPEQPTNPAPQQVTPSKWKGGPDIPAVVRVSVAAQGATFMFADGSGISFRNSVPLGPDLVLADVQTGRSAGKFQITFPEEDRMVLDGTLEDQKLRLTLRKITTQKKEYLLRTRGFHWIQDRPFNR